jgi:hypothetical protein
MYGNTVEGELWTALDSAAQEDSVPLPADIKTVMNSWTLKMGFPVVTIVRNYTSQTAIATQVIECYYKRTIIKSFCNELLIFVTRNDFFWMTHDPLLLEQSNIFGGKLNRLFV